MVERTKHILFHNFFRPILGFQVQFVLVKILEKKLSVKLNDTVMYSHFIESFIIKFSCDHQ